MEIKNKNARAATAIGLLAVPALWFLGYPFSSEVTVYSVYCGKDVGAEDKCIALPRITYKPFTAQQHVIYWTDTGAPATLTDCEVRDRDNWECWYPDRGGRLSMVDGVFREEILKDIPGKDTFDSVHYVPKWKWWAMQIGSL